MKKIFFMLSVVLLVSCKSNDQIKREVTRDMIGKWEEVNTGHTYLINGDNFERMDKEKHDTLLWEFKVSNDRVVNMGSVYGDKFPQYPDVTFNHFYFYYEFSDDKNRLTLTPVEEDNPYPTYDLIRK